MQRKMKWLSVLLAMVITCLAITSMTAGATQNSSNTAGAYVYNKNVDITKVDIHSLVGYYYGDVDMSGAIEMRDVLDTQKFIAQLKQLSEGQKYIADASHDGKVSLADIMIMQRYIAFMLKPKLIEIAVMPTTPSEPTIEETTIETTEEPTEPTEETTEDSPENRGWYYEDETDPEAEYASEWIEEVTHYEDASEYCYRTFCGCGIDLTDYSEEAFEEHRINHVLNGENNYSYADRYILYYYQNHIIDSIGYMKYYLKEVIETTVPTEETTEIVTDPMTDPTEITSDTVSIEESTETTETTS